MRTIAAVVLAATLAAAQDRPPQAEPPKGQQADRGATRHFWAAWKAGAVVKLTTVNDKGETVLTEEMTLEEASDKELRLGIGTVKGGTEGGEQRTAPWGEDCAHCDPDGRKVGEETLTIGEKTYACAVWQWRSRVFPLRDNKVWIAEGVGVPLKLEYKIIGRKLERAWRVVALDEEVEVDGRKIKCVRAEGREKEDKWPETKFILWLSAEVPGALAKMTSEAKYGDEVEKLTKTVTGFKAEK